MIKIILINLTILTSLLGLEIPTERVQMHKFGASVDLNAKIVQLSNAKQSIMSQVSGHIEEYYVNPAQRVKKGDKVARINSIMLSKITAEFISLKEQFKAVSDNYDAIKNLYEKGMSSMKDLNIQSVEKNAMLSRINSLSSQLETLGIESKALKQASSKYTLYAHSDGTVADILQPLHAVINEDSAIMTIIKERDYYIKAFLPLEYAEMVKIGQKLVVSYNNKDISTHITQIMPELDEKTQRAVVLSSIDNKQDKLFVNAYVSATLYLDTKKEYTAIKKSALSFFNNEWVVFVPKEEEHNEDASHDDLNDEHEGHDHTAHDSINNELGTHDSLTDEHDGYDHAKHNNIDDEHAAHDHSAHEKMDDTHGSHEEENLPYEAKVVEIITQDDKFTAIRGLELGQKYVSGKSYYVKSMMLKSSFGGHGH